MNTFIRETHTSRNLPNNIQIGLGISRIDKNKIRKSTYESINGSKETIIAIQINPIEQQIQNFEMTQEGTLGDSTVVIHNNMLILNVFKHVNGDRRVVSVGDDCRATEHLDERIREGQS